MKSFTPYLVGGLLVVSLAGTTSVGTLAQGESVISASTTMTSEEAWVHDVAEDAGLSFDGVPVIITDEGNCGEGCTQSRINSKGEVVSTDWVKISPEHIFTEYGKKIVLHELGHVNGILDECEADEFAISHGATTAPEYRDAHCL